MEKILFVGLGNMGAPMALNLIKAGFHVTAFDIDANARARFCANGGAVVDTLDDITTELTMLITMLQHGEQITKLCLGASGLYNKLKLSLHIDCSSIDLNSTKMLVKAAQIQNIAILDAPVSGGVLKAANASLTFMVGGSADVLKKYRAILAAMGENIYHAGVNGCGQAAKICNNMILGISMIAVAEAFTLAGKLGLAPEKLHEIVNHSSGQCWSMSNYPPLANLVAGVPANNDYKPGFSAAMMLKDLLLSQEAAHNTSLTTELAAQATAIYQKFIDAGHSALDFSAIIKAEHF